MAKSVHFYDFTRIKSNNLERIEMNKDLVYRSPDAFVEIPTGLRRLLDCLKTKRTIENRPSVR